MLFSRPIITERANTARLLVDADFLAYQVGSLSQFKEKQGEKDLEYVCLNEDEDTWGWIDPWNLVKWKINNELDKIYDNCNSDNAELYLTGSGNFRESVAVTKPYKGTRSSPRPYYFDAIRDYILDELDGILIEGIEADDAVSMEQTRDPDEDTMVVSMDKDLINTPGKLYNPRRRVIYNIPELLSVTHMLYQMVVGDRVDAIPGLHRRGEAWYRKNWHVDAIFEEYYRQDSSGELLNEQVNLLHMLQYGEEPGQYTGEKLYARAMEAGYGRSEISGVQPWSSEGLERAVV